MYGKSKQAIKHAVEMCKSDVVINANEVEIEKEEPEMPKMSSEELEEYLKAYIRNWYGSYTKRMSDYNYANGGYRYVEPEDVNDGKAQMIYDNLILKQSDTECIKSKVLSRAIKAVENFSPAYVKRVLTQLKKKVD